MIMALLVGGSLCACDEPEDTGESCPNPRELHLNSYEVFGETWWDGLQVLPDADDCGYPALTWEEDVSLVDRYGGQYPMEQVPLCHRRFAPTEAVPAGEYAAVVVHDVDYGPEGLQDVELELEQPFVVERWGHDHTFGFGALVGKSFVLDQDTVFGCPEVAPAFMTFLPGRVWLEIVEADAEQARFRLVQELDQANAHACVYLEDSATLSSTGELLWERDQLELATEPVVEAWDLSLRAGFDGETAHAAGLELAATINLENVVLRNENDPYPPPEDAWRDTCNLVASFGVSCEPCPETGQESCLSLRYFAAEAPYHEMRYDSDALPDCQVEMDLEYGACDLGCSSTGRQQAPWLVLGLLGLLGVRRRL